MIKYDLNDSNQIRYNNAYGLLYFSFCDLKSLCAYGAHRMRTVCARDAHRYAHEVVVVEMFYLCLIEVYLKESFFVR